MDDDGTYLISTFEQLQNVAKAVAEDPERYAEGNFCLTNPIHGNSENWTQPIGTEEIPFNGTFDGNGYFLYDYKIDTDQNNMAIFGVIGEKGIVKNLATVYGQITSRGEQVGDIAAYNYGVIENGANYGAVTGEETAAGIAADNSGSIFTLYYRRRKYPEK